MLGSKWKFPCVIIFTEFIDRLYSRVLIDKTMAKAQCLFAPGPHKKCSNLLVAIFHCMDALAHLAAKLGLSFFL